MKTPPDQIPSGCRLVVGQPDFLEACRRADLADLLRLSDRDRGVAVTDHRSSWVRRDRVSSRDIFIKTYDYPSPRDRWRGALRTTWLAASRPAREAAALVWMREHGFPAPKPLLVLERRRWGWLWRAILVTEAWPGVSLDHLAPSLDEDARRALGAAVSGFVRALHRAGFRDRNLDARNLLCRAEDAGSYLLAKVDSPRHRVVRPGSADDRLARADWARLAPQLQALRIPLDPPA